MSKYSHRGYEHRTSGYGRRRHKASGFKKQSSANTALKAAIALAAVTGAFALVYLFADNISPFVNSLKPSSTPIETIDIPKSTIDVPETIDEPLPAEGEFDGEVFISGDSGYLRFKGINTTAKNYSAVLNSISSSMSEKIQLFSAVIPTKTDIVLDGKLEGSNSQLQNLDTISGSLYDRIINIDVYDALSDHRNEYIYYRTDENMTSLGAYYTYLEAAQAAGLDDKTIYSLETLSKNKGRISPFEGSFIELTKHSGQPDGNPKLTEDTVEYFKLPVKYNCFAYDSKNGSRRETNLFSESAAANDTLNIFPGKDTPLIVIENLESKNSGKLLIVKDHNAEAVIGYFVPNYAEVHAAEVSLFKGNLREYVNENKITHVLFINGIDNANNSLYCQRLRDLFDNSISD